MTAPSYPGAVAAIQQRMRDQWSAFDIDRVVFQNEDKAPPWPRTNPDTGVPLPFIVFEVIGNDSSLRTAGKPDDHDYIYLGHILGHVFVPIGDGDVSAQDYAWQIGEIFRGKSFYNDPGTGAIVRTWSPKTDGGGRDAEDGQWYRVTCTIPFEFYYRG